MTMKKRIVFIVPYFGKLPDYFQLFLNSCSYNRKYDWIIFSDDESKYQYPSNVHLIKMTFEQCREIIQSKFNFEITLPTPQKLCDYKCAYGYLFSDYLKEYDWWGHCDLDQIFGNLANFISEEMLDKYDKIGSIGHMTLYKNTVANNMVFMSTNRYREVFTSGRGYGFDEWLPDNINEIYLKSEKPVFYENMGADINSYKMTFQTVHFDVENRVYNKSKIPNSIFQMDKGHIYQVYIENKETKKKEYPYVHLQKRRMKDCRKEKRKDSYYIVPNKFIDGAEQECFLIRRASVWKLFNLQFFRVKIKSLKYRIKNADWEFTNVFK